MKKTLYHLAIAALMAVMVQPASATVLLTDNFMVSSNSQDVNQELAGRQIGTLAPATYDGWQIHHQVGNTTTDVGQPGGAANSGYVLLAFDGSFFSDLDIPTVSSGPLTIQFDMYEHGANPGGAPSGYWGAVTLRTPVGSDPCWPIAGAGEFGFLQDNTGAVQIFQNGGNIQPGGWNAANFATDPHWTLIFSDTAGTGSAFVGNGSKVTMINGTNTLGTVTLTQLKSADLRLGFRDYSSQFVGIANLSISGTPAAPLSPNLSFEYDVTKAGNGISAFTTWHRFYGPTGVAGGAGGDIGCEFANGTDYTVNDPLAAPADGNQFLFINMFDPAVTGGVYQDMGPIIPNHTYTLTVAIGSRADRINSPGIISLVNGTDNTGTVLATTNGLPATQNTWQDYTVTCTTGPAVTGDLTICLSVLGDPTLIQADFDNVRLDAPTNAPPLPVIVQNTLPTYAETVAGDQVVFSAAFSNSPAANLQWLVVTNGVTNMISGATGSTLTLSNVQPNSTGFYILEAVNATNSTAVTFTSPRQLVVGSTPAPVNGVIVKYAGQTFPSSTNFIPDWPVDTSNLSLIYGSQIGSGPGTFTYQGDFTGGGNYCNADPTVLSDGMIGSMTSLPNLAFCACGPLNDSVGYQVTYTLQTSLYGMDITNITVFGGWQDAGRDEQKYQVLYSTVQAPASFSPLLTVDYVPTDTANQPVVSRTTLVPANTVLVHNVAALRISWNVSPDPKAGWEGYSEILAGGNASTGFVPALTNDVAPSTASDVVGSQLILNAGFSGATTLQWQLNGTNIPGATASTLTLNNLQLTNTGAYTLLASNSIGVNSSSACTVTVQTNSLPVNNIKTAIATQTSVAQVFTPTWDSTPLASSLIYNSSPTSSGDGDFSGGAYGSVATGGSGPSVLTDGTFGTIDFVNTGLHAWVTCLGYGVNSDSGFAGGQFVVYTLPDSPNGYNITNIMTAGGWNDGGRDQQAYTVNYATAANPTYFTPLAMVNYNPTSPNGYSMSRATITPANGVLASNVVALEFDMTTPPGENGFSGYSEIGVYGYPSANPPPVVPVISIQHEETSFDWTVETPNLIANQLPSSNGPGVFTSEGCTEAGLTDGVLAFGGGPNSASCGANTNASVSWIAFTPTNGSWNITNIVVYSLWHDFGRDGQFYNLSYSSMSAPNTFLPLASVAYNPPVPHDGRASGNRVQITPPVGQSMLASNVAAVKFDFTPQGAQDLGWSGYTEIVLQGTNVPSAIVSTLPTMAPPRVSGGNLIMTGINGVPVNDPYVLLTTTNLSVPIIWTTNFSGMLDGNGSFSNSIPIGPSPVRFFRFKMQ